MFITLLAFVMAGAALGQDRMEAFQFLVGEYTVQGMQPEGDGWVMMGEGVASVYPILGNTFLREELHIAFGEESSLTMDNTFGIDSRHQEIRMMAIDEEYGNMDFYKGEIQEGALVFTNLHSDTPFETASGQKLSYRLTYRKLSDQQNESLVEVTTDRGATWQPYLKLVFTRGN